MFHVCFDQEVLIAIDKSIMGIVSSRYFIVCLEGMGY